MPHSRAVLEAGQGFLHGGLKGRVGKNKLGVFALNISFQVEQILRHQIGNSDAVFRGKNPGEIRDILIETDVDTCFGHGVPPLSMFPSYTCLLYTSPSPRDGLLSR